ncbi:hypothetical protein IW262DRAFT_1299877 [Armillaria fumosa]|nr:hypothetical protein IW262DRAFT_1299877 [Armillaria fumosa]
MPHAITRRNAQRRHWQDYSDDGFPCKDLIDAVVSKTINPSLVLHEVIHNIALISAEDIHYDPASVSEQEFGELIIPLAASSACIHGIRRLVDADPQTLDLQHAIDLWPRLLPWIMFFFNQVVLRRPELFNSYNEELDTDMLLEFSRTGAISGLALSSVMLGLPSILHNSPDIMSCVAHMWIVVSEHRLEGLTKMLVQTVKQERPVPRLTSVLSRLIGDNDCVNIPWDVIRDDLSIGPRWIVQALKHTHFLLSVLKCCPINPPAHLRYGLSQILLVITTNLIWRTVLRQVRKSLMKIDMSVIDSPGFPSELAKSWSTLLDVVNHRANQSTKRGIWMQHSTAAAEIAKRQQMTLTGLIVAKRRSDEGTAIQKTSFYATKRFCIMSC